MRTLWTAIFLVLFSPFIWNATETSAKFSLEEVLLQHQQNELLEDILFPVQIENEKVSSFSDQIFTNIGSTVSTVYPMKAISFNDENGVPHMIVGMQGEPAVIVVINLQTRAIVDQQRLDGAKAVWAIEKGEDQVVYVGTTPNEKVYSYHLKTRQLNHHGKATTSQANTTIWDLTYDKSRGIVYGSNSYVGGVFSFKEGQGFRDFGQMASGKQFARSVAIHEPTNTLFVGAGSKAELIVFDQFSGTKENILPQAYRQESSVYELDIVGNYLFAKLDPTQKILVFDIPSRQLIEEFPAGSSGVSDKAPNENAVYYTFEDAIYRYDLDTREKRRFPANMFGTSAVSLDFVTYQHDWQFPGVTLVGLSGNSGRFFRFNLQTERFEMGVLNLPPQPTVIHHISKLPNGDIVSSGFISGNMGIFNPTTNSRTVYRGHGQIEGAAQLGNKMYYGVYPNARIYEFNPNQSWQHQARVPMDLVISDLDSFGQDRPVAMVGVEEVNKLFIGTFPRSGKNGGALVIYDPVTRTKVVRDNLITNHSIISMTYRKNDNHLYFGTSVYGGSSSQAVGGNAGLYAIPVNNPAATPIQINLPLSQPQLISALTVTPDGRIWGMADGNLFVYQSLAEQVRIIPIVPRITGHSRNATLVVGDDGHIYGTVERTLFRVDVNTLQKTILRNRHDADLLVKGNNGDLFFMDGLNLFKADFNKLKNYAPEQVEVPLSIPNVTLPASHRHPVARLYVTTPTPTYKKENGRFVLSGTVVPNATYRTFGVEGNYYHLGGGTYVESDPITVFIYIGEVMVMEDTVMYNPIGQEFRTLKQGEKVRIYSYDDTSYFVGDGYYILNDERVRYVIGTATPSENVPLYGSNGEVLGLIQKGYPFAVHRIEGRMLFIEGDYYIIESDKIRFSKN